MPHARPRTGARFAAFLSAALALTGLQLLIVAPAAQADVSSKIATFPYTQDWSNAGLITTNDSWSGVTGVQGYLGQDITTGTGTDPQTLTSDSALANDTDVIANQTNPSGSTAGGVAEFEAAFQSIALQGSGTADAPNVVFHLDLTGKTGTTFSFDAKDLDGSSDNAVQPIAVQYRVGAAGAYTNLPAGYIADTSTGPSLATLVSHRDVTLPAAADNQPSVFVRVLTTNAVGSDEWVGIDNVSIVQDFVPPPVSVNAPGNKTGTVNVGIAPFQLAANGGVQPFTWEAVSGMPPGVTVAPDGVVSGTPTTAGEYDPIVQVTDSSSPTAGTDTETFSFDIGAAPTTVTPIASIQGTGATSPVNNQVVRTQGEVTASYPTGGLNGFYIQTPGADTPNASDAVFVYGGANGFNNGSYPAIGDSVEVIGTVGEFSGQTQITANNAGLAVIADLPGAVAVKSQIPGTDCALPGAGCLAGAALDSAREVVESEAFQPAAAWTTTDVYDGSPYYNDGSNGTSMFGEIGLAADSTIPLVAPTEIIDAQATAAKNERIAYNNAHRIILDDASATNYTTAANTGLPFPWLTPTHQVRVGAAVTFPAPVIFTSGFNAWRLVPTTQVVGAPTGTQPQFAQTRAANAAPQAVGGDVKLATFNVLNFFPTTGNEFVALGGGRTCTYFTDRDGNQITNNSCNPNGPRGAANNANLVRQRDKIVSAINTAGADIVSLEELENSVHYGKPRDFAINALVSALNAAAGPGTWAAVPSPAAADLPPLAEQDVIRNGFIYKPSKVALVGGSVVLADQSSGTEAFADAREPLAQAFKRVGTPDADAFAVIVNHFKSKGSGTADPDGQGNANDRRMLQANALVTFANDFKTLRGITRVFLAGDFNAYSEEDPIQILNAAGYTNLESTSNPEEESYNFDGQIGSLDHVLANAAALADVEGVDIWEINSNESVYYEYSRYNYNVTNLYLPGPFKSSDHNPELVGIDTADPTTTDVQILGTNDFHGRISKDPTSAAAGAGVLAGAVNELRGNNPNSIFAAAGDLIGASTFESFILNDKPTIDALNEAGLDVSSVGNHEFDQGYDDLVDRVMADYDATTNPEGGAEWAYLGANVRFKANDNPALPSTWTKDFGSIRVGFVGTVTEHLPELVSPGGIEEIKVTDIVTETNAAANDLVNTQGADIVVMLVHEGAPMTNCTDIGALAPDTDFGSIVKGVNDNVDAIVSGHTHLEYNCSFAVPGWTGRPVTERPVVSAGQYGAALNKLVFTVDNTTGEVQSKTQSVVRLKSCSASNGTSCGGSGQPAWVESFATDADTQAIVADAEAEASVLGAVPLGQIAGPIKRGYLANGTTENRGVESTLGNLVAEAQRWQTSGPEAGSAQIAFMNPGGLRTDMLGKAPNVGDPNYPRVLTYKQAAEVQPFANGLVNMDLTGAQIKTALEQQWQPAGASRPFLKLGASQGFTYTSVPPPAGSPAGTKGTVTGMWLNGVPLDLGATYSVTVNGFLATGGDNFGAFAGGLNKAEAGLTDLQAMVNYMDEFANTGEGDAPLPAPTKQNGVHVVFPAGAPASYASGDHVTFDVSGWSFSNAADPLDTEVVVKLGATTLGTFPLNNAIQAALPGFDATGTTSVDVVIPAGASGGTNTLVLSGATTGTEIPVPVNVTASQSIAADDVTITYGQQAQVQVTVTGNNGTATGTVELFDGAQSLGSASMVGGVATITLAPRSVPAGTRTLRAVYSGGGGYSPAETELQLTVLKATPTLSVDAPKVRYGQSSTVTVTVAAGGAAPGGTVEIREGFTLIASGTVVNGTATITLPKRSLQPGNIPLTAVYSGDANTQAGSAPFVLQIVKAKSKVDVEVKPQNIRARKTDVRIAVKVEADGVPTVGGKVKITVQGLGTTTLTLFNGKAVLELAPFKKAGTRNVTVKYLGNDQVNDDTAKDVITVKP